MAHLDLEEQEQVDSLKAWWSMYGTLVTGLVTAAAIVVVGWQAWNWYQGGQSAQAAAVYGVLEQGLRSNDAQKIKAASGELTEKFSSTPYAALGAMLAARQSFDAGDLKTAKIQLQWVVDHGKNEIKDLAKLRLAAVLLDENAPEDAIKLLEGGHAPDFAARFLEMKGDVLAVQGKKQEASQAYKSALEKLGQGNDEQRGFRELLQQKLESVGGAV